MFRKSFISACLIVAGSSMAGQAFVGNSVAVGQDGVLDELYGNGVHKYFAHDYASALENLTLAIDNGSQDPRAYYFRGLAAAAMGQVPQTELDFRTGAMLEARGAFGGIIGRSLARIQGPVRIHMEKHRQLARLELLTQKRAKDDIRFGNGGMEPTAPPAMQPSPAQPGPGTAVPPTPDTTSPFADDPIAGGGEPSVDSSDSLGGALEAAQPTPVGPADGGQPPAAQPNTPAGDTPFPFGGDTPAENNNDPFSF